MKNIQCLQINQLILRGLKIKALRRFSILKNFDLIEPSSLTQGKYELRVYVQFSYQKIDINSK